MRAARGRLGRISAAPRSEGGSYQAIDIDRKSRCASGVKIWACNYECILLFRRTVGLVEG